MTQTKKHNVSLHDLTLFPLGLDATVPVGFQEAGPVTVQLAGIAAALAGAGIPLRPPKSTNTPGLLIAECLDAELTRVSTPELRVAACLGVHLGYDEDYLYTLEDDGTDEEEALKDDELIVAAYPVSRRTISFSAMRALLDPYTGPLGLSVPLGLALHVACEQSLGAALRICGPVGAMDMRSFDGMEDPDEEEDSICYDLARDRLQATSQHTGKKTVAQDNQDLHKLARAVTDKELADHIQKSGLLTLRRMYDHYGFRHLPERHNVTTEQLRRILDHTQKCGLDPRTARAVRRWIIELERLQVVDQDVYAQIKALHLHHVGNPMRRTVYGLREPTIVLDILGPGQHPDSGFVGGLDERIQERCHAEMQSCNPDVPLTAVCLTAGNAGAVLTMCRALGELERGACALFEDISRWSELTLAQLRTGTRRNQRRNFPRSAGRVSRTIGSMTPPVLALTTTTLLCAAFLGTALLSTAGAQTQDLTVPSEEFDPAVFFAVPEDTTTLPGLTTKPGADGTGSATGELSRNYPVQLDLAQLSRAGATPGTGYVILRDLKSTLNVSSAADRISISSPGRILVYRKGQRAALLNGQPAALNATPVGTSEDSLFPLAALKLLGCSYQPLESQRQVRTYALSCPGSAAPLAVQALTLSNANPGPGPLRPSSAPRARR